MQSWCLRVCCNWRTPILKTFCARSLMLSVVVLTGLLQQKNSNFESVMRRKFAATGMSASKFSVQFGLRCNWRISMLKVLHAAICCAQRFSLSELAFAPPFSGIYTHLYLYLFMLFSDIYIYTYVFYVCLHLYIILAIFLARF